MHLNWKGTDFWNEWSIIIIIRLWLSIITLLNTKCSCWCRLTDCLCEHLLHACEQSSFYIQIIYSICRYLCMSILYITCSVFSLHGTITVLHQVFPGWPLQISSIFFSAACRHSCQLHWFHMNNGGYLIRCSSFLEIDFVSGQAEGTN